MTDTNQKLREALQAISHIDDTTNHSVDASAALDRIGQIARQALALPTADHIPDAGGMVADHLPNAGKMIETAAPVGELPELPEPDPMADRWLSSHIYTADQMRAYARAALSAGVVPDGYALIAVNVLKAWGKLEEVQAACVYPIAAPPASQEQAQQPSVTVRYDLTPAMVEGQIRDKLIELGWTPPTSQQAQQPTYNELLDIFTKALPDSANKERRGFGFTDPVIQAMWDAYLSGYNRGAIGDTGQPYLRLPTLQPAPASDVLPEFDALPDDLIDQACEAGGLYRVDLMKAWNVLRAALSAQAVPNPWRDAVIEQLEGWHICVPAVHENSPRLAIKALVNIETQAALDPKVSSQAAALAAGAVPDERDKVDAQRYRWLADCNNYEAGLALIIDPKLTEQALGAAIDAAMRKDKP